MAENLEREIIRLIATDRIDKPISSMSGKLKRAKPKIARGIDFGSRKSFDGERAYARIESEDILKARGTREGIEAFKEAHPKYGAILEEMISEERASTETHMYFGMHEGRRLTSDDYMGVMTGLGFSETMAEGLYRELMDISYGLARKRKETERRILIG